MTYWSSFLRENLSQVQRFIPKTWNKQTSIQKLFQQKQKFQLLEEKSKLDSVSSSLKAFATQGNLCNAFKAYSLLQHSISSSTFSYSLVTLHSVSALLSCCNITKAFLQGKQLHGHIITLGFEHNPLSVPKLVTFYSSFGFLTDAHVITFNSKMGCSVEWNLLISAYVKYGFCREALFVYRQMVDLGVKPDNFTYPSVLKACGTELDLGFGREVHKCIDGSDFECDLFVQNALVTMYVKCGELEVAHNLFDKMQVRDVVSWNSLVAGYASKGMWEYAFELFGEMRIENAIEMNTVTWNTIAGGCLETANYRGALELISQMRYHGVDLDSVTIVIGLGACSQSGFFVNGKEIHSYAVRSRFDGLELVRNALIIMYSRCKDLRHAHLLFRSTEGKSLITWNSMIAGCIFLGQYKEVLFFFKEMLSAGVKPNYVTIASILPFCAHTRNLMHGKEIHCKIIKHRELKDHLLLWNSLVELYSNSGNMLEAQRVFDSMHVKDKVTYTSLIAGYGMQGKGRAALKFFEEMNMYSIEPDHITMVAVLSACSRSCLVFEGQMIFEKMINIYKMNPQVEHFACMVDLYGTAGLLRKAAQIIIQMPFQPTHAMLATLIKACRIHGNATIKDWATRFLQMRPE